MADAREPQFQNDILAYLTAHGWLRGKSSAYDRERALYPEDALGFFQEAYPDQWAKFAKHYPQDTETKFLDNLARQLQQRGTLDVLRHGYKDRGARIRLCQFRPEHGMNPDTLHRYEANRLRVVPELSYSPHAQSGEYNPRLDLVLFVNGLPTATLELKSEFKQSAASAKRQYRNDRPPKDPKTKREEPLLTFKRGALVHFAVSQFEVAMTTRLASRETAFLPFNQGTEDGGAGNPPNPDDYDTAYLWERVFQPDTWLSILGRFLHLERETKEDFHGKRYTVEKLIFPRFHQWDVVNKLLAATREAGPGERYLVQHSAGSGKSNSIAWTAHQIASLYDDKDKQVFHSVIVVTDRTVLDDQLQETIYQFEHADGVVRPISRDEGQDSKSVQLAEALAAETPIIVVTLQTFPALFSLLDERPDLAGKRYAVIADEAHSSQTGTSANKLRALLAGLPKDDEGELTSEDVLDAAVAARKPSRDISYYAFTATPKAKTLELFGQRPDPGREPSEDNKPEAFHVYSMRQAIEEGFILDVLQNYVSYNTAYRLAHPDGDEEVDTRKTATKIARWVRLHPVNIGQKVEAIVEHFRDNVAHLLDGQAKAMVVTGSRKEAVRYKLALDAYVREHGYDNVHALVAFSGMVGPDKHIPAEVSETSSQLNPNLRGRDMREAFDTDEYNVMIVANKFQTGFDQPKLCAMYVDKKLQGVDCVQTLSRLNRTFPGKESSTTFILDFVNDPKDVRQAFEPYYGTAELETVSDPNQVYELQRKLDEERIYRWEEVEAFARAFFDPKGRQSELTRFCRPARDRFRDRYKTIIEGIQTWRAELKQARENGNDSGAQRAEHELKELGEQKDTLDLFRKNLATFVRFYEFISQIVDFEDPELEQLNVFAKHLYPLLRDERVDEDDIDLSELQLTHYRLTKQGKRHLRLGEETGDYGLKPPGEVGTGQPRDAKKERLAEIIRRLNELFGADVSNEHQLRFAHNIADTIRNNETVMAQVESNPADEVMRGDYPKAVVSAVLDHMDANGELSERVLENDQIKEGFARLVLDLLTKKKEKLAY